MPGHWAASVFPFYRPSCSLARDLYGEPLHQDGAGGLPSQGVMTYCGEATVERIRQELGLPPLE